MSYSEYNGSKSKVSSTVGRILRNAQESFPKMPASPSQGSSGISSLFKSISNSVASGNNSDRLCKSASSSSDLPSQSSKFGFQKLRLGGSDKKRGKNLHAELLDNQDIDADDSDVDETNQNGNFMPVTHTALIDSHMASPSPTKKEKKWLF